MRDTPILNSLEVLVAEVARLTSEAVVEIVLAPEAYRALQAEFSGIGVTYGAWNDHTGFAEAKIHGPAGITRIRPHIPELDDYR